MYARRLDLSYITFFYFYVNMKFRFFKVLQFDYLKCRAKQFLLMSKVLCAFEYINKTNHWDLVGLILFSIYSHTY